MGITAKGYRRVYDPATKRLRMEHDLVWERAHGHIPAGFHVHHINHDKLDNRLENLELLDPLTHKRHHSGCEWRDGMWWKPCRKCSTVKPITEYYAEKSWISPWCRSCQIENAVRNKQKRRAAKRHWRRLEQPVVREITIEIGGRTLAENDGERQPTAA